MDPIKYEILFQLLCLYFQIGKGVIGCLEHFPKSWTFLLQGGTIGNKAFFCEFEMAIPDMVGQMRLVLDDPLFDGRHLFLLAEHLVIDELFDLNFVLFSWVLDVWPIFAELYRSKQKRIHLFHEFSYDRTLFFMACEIIFHLISQVSPDAKYIQILAKFTFGEILGKFAHLERVVLNTHLHHIDF